MSKQIKTNAARLLDAEHIKYSLIPYEVDESDLSAKHVAEQLNEPVEQLFKTLVLKGNKTGHFVCIIPGDETLDLKKVAQVSGNKSCEMILMKDLLNVTGYIRGACSPIGMKKQLPSYIHNSATNHELIYISAGKRGLQIQINPTDLIRVADLKIENLI